MKCYVRHLVAIFSLYPREELNPYTQCPTVLGHHKALARRTSVQRHTNKITTLAMCRLNQIIVWVSPQAVPVTFCQT